MALATPAGLDRRWLRDRPGPIALWHVAHPERYADSMHAYRFDDSASVQTAPMWSVAGLRARLSAWWQYFNPDFMFLSGDSSLTNSTRSAGFFPAAFALLLPLGIVRLVRFALRTDHRRRIRHRSARCRDDRHARSQPLSRDVRAAVRSPGGCLWRRVAVGVARVVATDPRAAADCERAHPVCRLLPRLHGTVSRIVGGLVRPEHQGRAGRRLRARRRG